MKVKTLISYLQSMPQEANVQINIRQSKMLIDITNINDYKIKVLGEDKDKVEIVGNWRDFDYDEEENRLCQQELDKEENTSIWAE